MEIRQITAEERAEFMVPLQAYAFEASPGGDFVEHYRRRVHFFTTATNLVAVEDGRALACAAAFPMEQNVRGAVRSMAGVASVASHPEARRRGLVRQLLDRLLRQMRDQGCVVSALYPFRPSFYGRFGFVGLPRVRQASFATAGLSHLVRAELPGTVERLTMAAAFDEFDALTRRLLGTRHGFSVYDATRTAAFRDDKVWVALARVQGQVVGAVRYRIDRHGGDLLGDDLLVTGPLGRALLLQFFARHVDQVARVVLTVGTDDVPELWGTDLAVTTEGRVTHPDTPGPMARVLDLTAMAGGRAGNGEAVVEVVDDGMTSGTWALSGADGVLGVERADGATPVARMSVAGISGLLYGVLDPVDVVTRGFGQVEAGAVDPLRALFPREMPYLFADF